MRVYKTLQGINVTLNAATVGQLLIKWCCKLLNSTTSYNLTQIQKSQGHATVHTASTTPVIHTYDYQGLDVISNHMA